MDKLGSQAYGDPNLVYKYRGEVNVPPLQMVDYVIMESKCGNQVVTSNSTVSTFMKLKKLDLSETKCARIHIGKSNCDKCPTILVNDKVIKESEKEKYLGDYLTESATATETIKDRKRKGYGILGEIRAILEDIPLGNKRLEIGLPLRAAWFLNGTLYNSEVWGSYRKEDIEALEVLDRKILRLIVGSHSKSANEILFLETAVLPVSAVISVRRMIYLHTLLQREDDEITKQIYLCQLKNPYPGDWVKLLEEDKREFNLNLSDQEICAMSIVDYKKLVKTIVQNKIFLDLRHIQDKHTKIKHITYTSLVEPQSYFKSDIFNNKQRKLLYTLRSKSASGFKDNFHCQFDSISCQLHCQGQEDSQEHLLSCQSVISCLSEGNQQLLNSVKYSDLFGTLEEQLRITNTFLILIRVRIRLLERHQKLACEGSNTRPCG